MIHHAASADEIYPNPTTGQVTIELSMLSDAPVVVKVTSVLGQKMIELNQGTLSEGEHFLNLDLSPLPAGLYVVNVKTGQQINSYKIIKN